MMNRIGLLLIVLSLFAQKGLLNAQIQICGSYVSEEQVNNDTTSILEGNPASSLPQVNRSLALAIYISESSAPKALVIENKIKAAISALNSTFSPIALKFRVDTVVQIKNYTYNKVEVGQNKNMASLVSQYSTPSTINLYLVGSLVDFYGFDVYGLTFMPGDSNQNYIFLRKDTLIESGLKHQMGHFLNLYHTHESALGNELVKRTNCITAGDRCCDTEADPIIKGLVDINCVYTGSLKDADKDLYAPSVRNYMSFSSELCKCYFTRTQYLRVADCVTRIRKSLR